MKKHPIDGVVSTSRTDKIRIAIQDDANKFVDGDGIHCRCRTEATVKLYYSHTKSSCQRGDRDAGGEEGGAAVLGELEDGGHEGVPGEIKVGDIFPGG